MSDETLRAKQAAADAAASLVEAGMKLGLGTGSTADVFVRALASRAKAEALKLTCVATSVHTARLAMEAGLDIVDLDKAGWLDLTVDGADEVGPYLDLIKGGGGALLREKIVAAASERMVVIADESKDVASLGAFPLPVEVTTFGAETTRRLVEEIAKEHEVDGVEASFRMTDTGGHFATDQGNWILDLRLGRIGDPADLHLDLLSVPGVVETGLFINMADAAIFGMPDGSARVVEAPDARPDFD